MAVEYLIVATTTDSAEAAQALSDRVIAARLGACAQVIGPITSVYRWQGAVETAPEWRVEIKTAADRVPELVAELTAAHSYEVPEIVATPIVAGSAQYLAWLAVETRPAPNHADMNPADPNHADPDQADPDGSGSV